MTTKREAKAAIKALIQENPTWADDRVWAALKEDGYELVDKAIIADVRYTLGAKDTWSKEKP